MGFLLAKCNYKTHELLLYKWSQLQTSGCGQNRVLNLTKRNVEQRRACKISSTENKIREVGHFDAIKNLACIRTCKLQPTQLRHHTSTGKLQQPNKDAVSMSQHNIIKTEVSWSKSYSVQWGHKHVRFRAKRYNTVTPFFSCFI